MSVGGGVLAPTSPSMGMAVGAGSSAGRGSKHPKKDLLVCTLCGARSRSTARVPPSPLLSPPSPPLSPPSPPLSVSPPPPFAPTVETLQWEVPGRGWDRARTSPHPKKGLLQTQPFSPRGWIGPGRAVAAPGRTPRGFKTTLFPRLPGRERGMVVQR